MLSSSWCIIFRCSCGYIYTIFKSTCLKSISGSPREKNSTPGRLRGMLYARRKLCQPDLSKPGRCGRFCSPSTLKSSCSEDSVQTVPWPRATCVWQQGQQEGWWALYRESAKCSNAFSFFPLSFYSFLYTFLLNVPLSAPRLSYCPQHLLSYCLLSSWWEDNDLVSFPHSSDVSGAALIFQLLYYMIKSVVVTDRPACTVEAPGVTGSTGPSGIHSHYSYTLYIPIRI